MTGETMTEANKKNEFEVKWSYLVIAVVILVVAIVIALIIRANRAEVSRSQVSNAVVGRKVEQEYLDAANKVFDQVDESEVTSNLDNALMYAWAKHQYYLTTADQKALRQATGMLDTIERLQKSADNNGLVCVLLADMINDQSLGTDVRSKAKKQCDNSVNDFYVDVYLEDIRERVKTGREQEYEEDETDVTLYMYDAEWMAANLSDNIRDGLEMYVREGVFPWDLEKIASENVSSDDDFVTGRDPEQMRELIRNQIYTEMNKYTLYNELYDNADTDLNIEARRDNEIDYLYLLGQNLNWYINYASGREEPLWPGVPYDEDIQCLLGASVRQYLAGITSIDAGTLSSTAKRFKGIQSPMCEALGFRYYDMTSDPLDRELVLSMVEYLEGISTADKLAYAGLLTQEAQEQVYLMYGSNVGEERYLSGQENDEFTLSEGFYEALGEYDRGELDEYESITIFDDLINNSEPMPLTTEVYSIFDSDETSENI